MIGSFATVMEPQLMWMRVHGQLGDDRALHDAGLAYLADLGMNPVPGHS